MRNEYSLFVFAFFLPVAHKALAAWIWLECSLFEHYSGLDALSLLILC